ncbi:Ribonuclease TUDOR 1 [Phytophthora citrophthora]|uniref:Ribonuclease TUDOR 1 n=1 Tax=Phytophthora citrophthora TaxID=4793 RepID=A0AAD9G8X3_9STRA|nr:Ribonuclease TUDOR 1 [Phytophthora citrophthora]
MASGHATVKAVLSGDTLVLIGAATNGPPPELMLTLSSLQAPRLARSPEQSNEPYAWASREHLRKLCVGKQVRFKVEYRVPAINRDFGSVWLPANSRGVEENLCVIQARTGYAKVKTLDQSRDGVCVDHEKMLQQEQVAINEKKGMYADADAESNATVQWHGADAEALVREFKGKLVPAIVESVRDGASLRVILKPSLQLVNFGLAGVQCPRINPPVNAAATEEKEGEATPPPAPVGPAPHAREAKHFTEVRLLHRDVELKLEGVDKYGNLYGSVVHPSGRNISVELLKSGLGRMADWSSAFTSASARATMRTAEKEAKQQKLRVWREYEAPVLQSAKHLTGTVVEVISGDCLVVYVPDAATPEEQEKRIYLSSLRAPRLGNARRNEPNAPYAGEAKEFLRNRAIAKTVHIEVEYEKPSPSGQGDVMTFASVFLEPSANALKKNPQAKGANLAVDVVAAGLAEVVRHRPDEEKSEHYDDLVTAETKAQTQKKNLHSNKEAPSTERRVTDLCFDATKAKQFLPFLTRERSTRAVVEHVYSATRVKLFVPKENCLINFVVAGVKCPQPARHGAQGVIIQPAEPLGEEAKLFTKRSVMQREVMVEIEDMDRGGNAFGPLFVVPNGGGKPLRDDQHNFGVRLLEEGLAWVDSFSVERTALGNVLQRAEERAKAQKKKYWATHDAQAAAKAVQAKQVKTKDDVIPRIKLSEIVNGAHFYIQNVGDRNCAAVEEKMKAFTRTHGLAGKTFEVRRNAVCAALFDDGNGSAWNRAKVEYVHPDGSARVRFLDYGNEATVKAIHLRPLDADVLQFPPQAKEAAFAWIKPLAATEEFGSDAAMRLGEVAWGKTLSCRIHSTDDHGRMQVSLYLPDGKSVAENLVEAGLLRTDRKALRSFLPYQKPVVDGLLNAQETAKKQRRSLWQYGDIESDDEHGL